MKTTLIILAAGMSSRYGSLKQIDGFGPNNETIIDYSIYDAINSGFSKIIFVIRKSFEREFKAIYNTERYKNKIEIVYCFQETSDIPEEFRYSHSRIKPWGTNHAILCCKDYLKGEPFGVINADDFYGRESFELLNNFLTKNIIKNQYCVIGYKLLDTLSEYGAVTRAILEHNNLLLTSIQEVKNISIHNFDAENNKFVSMNMFGFNNDYIKFSENEFTDFLQNYANEENDEFYIPFALNRMIKKSLCRVKIVETNAIWFGVTYSQDKPNVVLKINELINQKIYPERLW